MFNKVRTFLIHLQEQPTGVSSIAHGMVKNYQKNLKTYIRLLVYTVYSEIYDIQISARYDGGRLYVSTGDKADMKVCFQTDTCFQLL